MSQENHNSNEGNTETHSGFIALLGAPNAGKSTLLNHLVGTKISIVTHKVQTTRSIVRGIVTRDNYQAIFLDTPGLFKPQGTMDKMMVDQAWGGAKDADIITVLVDVSSGLNEQVKAILDSVKKISKPKFLLLNKIDLIQKDKLLELTHKINEEYKFDEIFMISAIKGDYCQEYLQAIFKILPKGPFYYDPEQASTIALRELAAEITREKVYLRVHQELPYSCAVKTEKFEERADGSVVIEQVIYVEREGQKKIILGNKGEVIKAIGKASREELQFLFDCKVHLFLFVKVSPNWKNRPEEYCLL